MNRTMREKIGAAFPDATCTTALDTVVVEVSPETLHNTLARLKNDAAFNCGLLLDVTAIDYLDHPQPQPTRFAVVYTLRNWRDNLLVQVRCPVADPERGVPSACHLWGSANWGEREVYDQYGIRFAGHPDLRRLMLTENFQGHPLRREFPSDAPAAPWR